MAVERRAVLAGAAALGAMTMSRTAAAVPTPSAPWTDGGTVARAGGVIHWASLGEGPPLVVMPKLGGWIADWAPIAPLLATKFRVIAIDPPGHGGSRFSPPPPVQTVAESAALVHAALDRLGIARYALAGNSLGGCIAFMMAVHFPAEVTRLALLSVALGDRQSDAEIAAGDARAARDFDAHGHPLPRTFDETAAKFGMTRAIHAEQNRSRAMADLWIRPSERGVGLAGLAGEMGRVRAPALLLYGKGTSYEKYRTRALATIPDVRAATLDGAGAFMHQQAPAETAALLLPFLEGHS